MKKILTIVLILLLSACRKDFTDDVKGSETISGRLMAKNLFAYDNILHPLGNRMIKIAYSPSDTLNYIYSMKTDTDGYFRFNRLDEDKKYDIFFEDSVFGRRYLAFDSLYPPNDTLALIAYPDTTRQNIIEIITEDSSGYPTSASICIFSSKVAFNASDSCTGSMQQFSSDSLGRRIIYNLIPGEYYIRAISRTGNYKYKGEATLIVKEFGVYTVGVKMVPDHNTIKLTVTYNSSPVSNTSVCLYNIRSTWLNDTNCTGSIQQMSTNEKGEVSFTVPVTGWYYFRSNKITGNLSLQTEDSVEVTHTGINEKVTNMNQKAIYNIKFNVFDVHGGTIHDATVCLYSSKIIWDSSSNCIGSIIQSKTNATGESIATVNKPGWYYLQTKAQFGNLVLLSKDSFEVKAPSTLVNITLK